MDVFAHEPGTPFAFMRYNVFDSPIPSSSPPSSPSSPLPPPSPYTSSSPLHIPPPSSPFPVPGNSEDDHFEARFANVLRHTADANLTVSHEKKRIVYPLPFNLFGFFYKKYFNNNTTRYYFLINAKNCIFAVRIRPTLAQKFNNK